VIAGRLPFPVKADFEVAIEIGPMAVGPGILPHRPVTPMTDEKMARQITRLGAAGGHVIGIG